nr:RNA-directed DNA polymerase, eukaryota [Tanacetum cinerariifolium]
MEALENLGSPQERHRAVIHEFVSDERVVWVDIEGVPLNVWSRETFLKIGKKWRERMDIKENLVSSFTRKRLYIKTKQADNILEKFKVIFKGKENDHRGVDLNTETDKVNSPLVHTKVMNNSQKVYENVTSNGESAFNYSLHGHNGGSILEVLDNMIRVGQSMGYAIESDLAGSSGEILCVWEATIFKNSIAIYETWISNNSKVLIVVIYAPQSLSHKRVLWDYISSLIARWNGETIVMGDFNEVRSIDEPFGSMFNQSNSRLFNHFITSSGLVDVKLEGYSFTWAHPLATKMSKLDRFLVSNGIISLFPLIMALYLDRHLSDHQPILLREIHTDYGPILFCYYHSWFKWDGFDVMERDGDEYSNFFHGIINKKRSQLSIRGVFVDSDWNTNPEVVRDVFKDHFATRFKQPAHGRLKLNISFPNRLSTDQVADMDRSVSRDEIRAQFGIAATISLLIHAALIPKVTDAKFVTDFRPISLIGCVYKVVTKILATRLATVISDLIFDIQSAFVANRQILDGPFILNEQLAWCKRKTKQAMIFKVDFTKAATSDGLFKASLIGCAVMQKPFRYLGVMVGDSMSQKLAWADSVQKLYSRLSKWKVKTLYVEGRLTLLKSVLGDSPLYNMSIYKVPKGVLKEMEAIRCNFFNGADPAERKITWVSWDKVLASKKNGGLRVLSFHALNRTLLLKWVWCFLSQDGSLWYCVIQALYGASFELHPVNQSSIWCSILREMQVLISKGFDFVSHCKKHDGDGHNIRFWYDFWVFDQPLRVRFPRLFALETDKESTVASKFGSSSKDASFRRSVRDGVELQQWDDLNSVSGYVTLSASKDRWICDLNGDDVFRVKEVRTNLDNIFLPSAADAMRWVKYISIKINVFDWRARLDRHPTRSNLVRRGVVFDSSLCPLCGLVPEDIHHVLFRCDTAKLVFRRICRWWDMDWHDLLSFSDWNAWFSAIRLPSRIKLILEGVFYVAWWHLWVYRNRSIFVATPPRRPVIFDDIVSRSFTRLCSSSRSNLFRTSNQVVGCRILQVVELLGAQRDRKAEVFQVSNNDNAVAQRRLEDKQPEEKTNTDCLGRQTFGCCRTHQQNGLVNETNVTLFAKENIDQEAGLQEVLTQDLIDCQLARDRKQHLACELFGYRKDNNEDAFEVAAVEKIYAHESLTFNNIVVCEVISKWKAGLKDDMDARSDVYVLSNGCRKCSDDIDGYYWNTPAKRNILNIEIIKDQNGNTLKVSQSRIHNENWKPRVLDGLHETDIASVGVDMLDGFDRGLQTNVQVCVDFDYAMGISITVMSRSITGYGLMILGCAGSLKANFQHMEALLTIEAGYVTFTEA